MKPMSWPSLLLALAACAGGQTRSGDSRAQGGASEPAAGEPGASGPIDTRLPPPPTPQAERQQKLIEATDATRAAARALESAADADRKQRLTDYMAALDAAP